jgi:hypothetical protein
MQADVQRDINQQQRINNGVDNGTLTNHEVSKLERGEAHNNRRQFRAGRDGHVGAAEQHRVQKAENATSRGVWRKKHNLRDRHVAHPAT